MCAWTVAAPKSQTAGPETYQVDALKDTMMYFACFGIIGRGLMRMGGATACSHLVSVHMCRLVAVRTTLATILDGLIHE